MMWQILNQAQFSNTKDSTTEWSGGEEEQVIGGTCKGSLE